MLTKNDVKSKFSHTTESLHKLTEKVPRILEELLKTDPFLAPDLGELDAVAKSAMAGDALSQHLYACHFEMQQDFTQAIEFYEKAANQNFIYSIYSLANMYTEGKGCKSDSLKALSYLTQPALSEYGHALVLLARLYTDDENIQQNLPKALALVKKATKCNPPSAIALIRLGMYSELGLFGVKKSTAEAIQYYKSAMKYCSGLNRAPHIHLGLLYLKNPKTHKLAFRLFCDGMNIKINCRVSASYVAYCQIQGFGTQINISLGLKSLEQYVKEKVPQALYLYAQFIEKGIPGLAKNLDKYEEHITEAASLMHMESLFLHANACDQILFGNETQNTDTKIYQETAINKNKTATAGKDNILRTVQQETEKKIKKESLEHELKKIIKIYKSSAINGVIPAMHELSLCYFEGRGITKDTDLAFEWLTLAATNNHPDSMFCLGLAFLEGDLIEQDDKLAFEWLEAAATAGSEDAAFLLAKNFYRHGYHTVEKNDTQFLKWMKQAENTGNPDASYELGVFYYDQGNFELSIKHYQAAEKLGHLPAKLQLARCHLLGYGVKQNPKKGFNDLVALMAKLDSAKINVGNCYLEGLGTSQDVVKAKHIFNQITCSDNLGDLAKKHLLLICDIYEGYESKIFSEPFQSSFTQLEEMAKLGNQIAIQQVGEIYKKGIGVKRDPNRALTWFESGAAAHPSSNVLFELANLYEHGMGVKTNHELALHHYETSKLKDKRAAIRWNAIKFFNLPAGQSAHKFYITLQHFAQDGFQEAQIAIAIGYIKQLCGKKFPIQKGFVQLKELGEKFITTFQSIEKLSLITLYKSNDKTAQLEYMQIAFLNLGLCYLEGIGIEQNSDAARLWFKRTIEINLPETVHTQQAQNSIQIMDQKIKLEHEKILRDKQLQEKLASEQTLKEKRAHDAAVREKNRQLELAKKTATREAAVALEKALEKKRAEEAEALEKAKQEKAVEEAAAREAALALEKILEKKRTEEAEALEMAKRQKTAETLLAQENAIKVKLAQEAGIENAKQQRSLQEAVERQSMHNPIRLKLHSYYVPITYQNRPLYWINNRLHMGNQLYIYYSHVLYPTYQFNLQRSVFEYIGDYPALSTRRVA